MVHTGMMSHGEVITVVRARIRQAGLSPATERCYCNWVSHYYRFCLQLPWALPSAEKAAAFRSYLAGHSGVSARAQWQAGSPLHFLYDEVLRKPIHPSELPKGAR